MKKILVLFGVLMLTISMSAQKKSKSAKVQFEVAGICKMCKTRIEKAALTTKGVKYASWNVETHQLSLIINERKTTATTVKKSIAAVGHSSQEIECSIESYNNLDACCKYNDEQVVKDHQGHDEHKDHDKGQK